MAKTEKSDRGPPACPFTVLIDVNEQAPFSFLGIPSDKKYDQQRRPWMVKTERFPLYNYSLLPIKINNSIFRKGLADYAIAGMEHSIAIERKSMNDLFATLGQRRDEFEAELKRLDSTCKISHVVIEASRKQMFMEPPSASQLLPRIVNRTIIAWTDRYPSVHWHFCDSRREAELEAFHRLMAHWRNKQKA